MAYEKQEWTYEDWLKGRYNVQEKLNHIEEGIANAGEGGGGGSFSVDSAGAPGICDLAVRNDPPFIKFKLKDNYTEEELSQFADYDLSWYNTTPDGYNMLISTDPFNDGDGLEVYIEDLNSGSGIEWYIYLSNEAAEELAQQYGITPPAYAWLKLDPDSLSYEVLEHAPELKFLTNFDAYMSDDYYQEYNWDLLMAGIKSALAHIVLNADGSFKEHYTKDDEANLQGLIDATQVFRNSFIAYGADFQPDIAAPSSPEGGSASNTVIFMRSSQFQSAMSGESGVEYTPDYFPIIFVPHFGMSEEDTCIYIYIFAESAKKMRELSGSGAALPIEPDCWYKMTFDFEFIPVTVPDINAPDNAHDYLWLDTLFDCSELVVASQKVLVKRARKNHIIPMCWYNAWLDNIREFESAHSEGELDWVYSNVGLNILNLNERHHELYSAIDATGGWQNAIEFGCWVNSIQLVLGFINMDPQVWQYGWFEHFANSVLCGDKVRLFFSPNDFGGSGSQNIVFDPNDNSHVEISLAFGPVSTNTYADFTSVQRLDNGEFVLHGHLPVIVSASGQTNGEEPQDVSYENENFLIPVSLVIVVPPRD